MKHHFLSAALLCIAAGTRLKAQQQGSKPEYFKQVSNYFWQDNAHYVGGTFGSTQLSVTDAKTGQSSQYVRGKVVASERIAINKKTGTVVIRKASTDDIIGGVQYSKRDGEVVLVRTSTADSILNTQNATPSPDSTCIAYTRNNDLFVYSIASGKEWRVTTDGSKDVYSGWSAWVYNEEILGRGTNYKAFWWSPDSKRIAFMHFDETNVPVYDHFDDEGVHGKHKLIHYPQPGDANPQVKTGIADVAAKSVVWAAFDEKADQYFGQPYWTPNGSGLWVQWMNRRQDSLKVESVNLADGSHKNIYTETQKTWIDLDKDDRITFLPSKNMFLLMSDKSGWRHIYAYDMNGKLIKPLTNGNWTVKEINYADEKNGWIYFTARKENSTRTDLYKVKLDGSKMQRLTFGEYNHRVVLSPDASYFITTYSNYAEPQKVALVDNNGKIIRELADSKGKDYEQFKTLGRHSEIIRVKTPDGFELPVRISWPDKVDSTKKYPLMAAIYGGPDFSFVQDGFAGTFGANEKTDDIISIQMDHRGSGQFGKMGQDYLYRQLGKWEIEDYTTVIKFLEKKYPFIDSTRIGISGFSYGGYITCLALTKAADVFTYGLAGGSVTDWKLYDTPYTERYMGTPQDNPEGYKQADVMTYVKNYKGLLRLTQGTMDDNVHMQNTMQLVSALQNTGKHFELMFYPGGAHGWLSLHEKYAHYRKEDQAFIDKNLLRK
ncbi:S9 family peptidase [Pinibacter aurantiacus]|uniref:S9 family peptidase n=1 Tax=Pinibacter aurantiacus TaxID=2851599 RepID=A0A9E2W956_9BACT|nr:DPP IV N-terminal domain-containing protein [Pinibacter aurantiacus]MBV4359192.1 S9 family peptidase [Pinibacter aurantiacus]